jgi:hypothetical protein
MSIRQHDNREGSVVIHCHDTVVPGDCIMFGAPTWFTTVADCIGESSAGAEDLCLKDSSQGVPDHYNGGCIYLSKRFILRPV